MASLIAPLCSGFASAPSGSALIYRRGTTVASTLVYSDPDVTTTVTTHTLDSYGAVTRYVAESVDIVLRDASGATVKSFTWDDHAAVVEVRNTGFTGTLAGGGQGAGGRTNVDTALSSFYTSTGALDGKALVNGETVTIQAALAGQLYNVKHFGATGDGSTDDTTAIQDCIDKVKADGGGWVFFPKGTYKITAALSIDAAGVNVCGSGRGVAVIKNFATADNAITVNLGSAVDSKITVCDISITCNTTSNSAGITIVNGDRTVIKRCNVALHRRGIDVSAIAAGKVEDCIVESTDDNTAAIGIKGGARSRIVDCEVISGTVNGTGISMGGNDAEVRGCYTSKFVTGVSLGGNRSRAIRCWATAATTGFGLAASNTEVSECHSSANTDGYVVSANKDSCRVSCCDAADNTGTAITVPSTATLFHEFGNNWTGTVTNTASTPLSLPFRLNEYRPAAGTTNTETFTPLVTEGRYMQVIGQTHSAGNVSLTINATDTATLAKGDMMILVIYKTGANAINPLTWNAQYTEEDGGVLTTPTSVNSQIAVTLFFRWNGTAWRRALVSVATAL